MVFIIISITIFILHLQEGFKIIMMCSLYPNNAKLYGGEIGLHFHPHPLGCIMRLVLKRLPVRSRTDYLPLIPANN
jgi:hypothetical protein